MSTWVLVIVFTLGAGGDRGAISTVPVRQSSRATLLLRRRLSFTRCEGTIAMEMKPRPSRAFLDRTRYIDTPIAALRKHFNACFFQSPPH